jgi:hypothetical protein
MSITLSAPNVQTVTKGGSVIETNDAAAVVNYKFDYTANALLWEGDAGQMVSGAFVPGGHADRVTVYVDLATGKWNTSNGLSGTFNAGTLNAIVALGKSNRNTLEGYLVAAGVFPGTQVPWT